MSRRWIATLSTAATAVTAMALATANAVPVAVAAPTTAGVSADAAATYAVTSGSHRDTPSPGVGEWRTTRESARLAQGLAKAVRRAGFDRLVDFDDVDNGVAQPSRALPNVDVAVIELSRTGRIVGAANVLYDRDSPYAYRVPIDLRTMQPQGVRFSQWRGDRWDDQGLWDAGPASGDVLSAPAHGVRKDFMVPYPASVLKVMVGYGVLRLVDQGRLTLDSQVTYREIGGNTCGYGPSNPTGATPPPEADGASDTVASWMDQMITVSDNFATCVLLQLLDKTGGLKDTNANFARLGLTTLRMNPSQPEVGNGWSSGQMTMGALDTARLMLLVSGTTRRLWRAPDGSKVTGDSGLSRRSQRYFRSVLLDQSFHEVLSTGNLCGSDDAAPGIPARVSKRWIDRENGHVVTYDGDTPLDFGYDTRPCNKAAEVTFAHKTGLVSFSGNDTGIVKALPGEDGRWYVVAAHSNVGYRFGDADWATSDPNACLGAPYVCYSRAYGRLGRAIDTLVEQRPRSVR